jgi:hypothetical protein
MHSDGCGRADDSMASPPIRRPSGLLLAASPLHSQLWALAAQPRPVELRRHHRGHEGDHRPQLRPVALTSPSMESLVLVPNTMSGKTLGAGVRPGPGIGPDAQTPQRHVTQAISSRSWRQHWQFPPSHPADLTAALSRRPPAQPPRSCTSVAGPSRSRSNSAASSPRHNISNSTAYFAAPFHAPHYQQGS